jgi:hypothetical protein
VTTPLVRRANYRIPPRKHYAETAKKNHTGASSDGTIKRSFNISDVDFFVGDLCKTIFTNEG